MQIRSTTRDGVALLTLDGDVLGGPDGSALHDALAAARGDAPLQAVVDLSGVRFMNSSGLGMLVGALTTARNTGGDLRLAAVGDRVRAILEVTQLDGVFASFPTAADAVASYG
ncbi:STAS domain-containing protein [Rubrivirga sp.]|uniref:STAS domain-containing protein n=1 Tax=Rubrivirga sp. TaxID=1885344 RepID=UPI003B516E41